MEAVPVLLWVPRSRGLSRSQIMLVSMTAGFAVGALGEISGEAMLLFLENLVNEITLWSCMFLWCLVRSILCVVVMTKGLLGLSDKHSPRYGWMPVEVSFISAHIIGTNAVHFVLVWCLMGSPEYFPLTSLATLIALFCLVKSLTHEDDDDEDEKNSFIEKASTV